MTSSWDSYYIVFISAILSLGIPGLLALISFLFFPRSSVSSAQLSSSVPVQVSLQVEKALRPNKTLLGQRINVRFFLAANAALILITMALALIPCSTTLQSENRDGLLKGMTAIVTIAGFAALGLLYSVRKGDMGWLSSYQKDLVSPNARPSDNPVVSSIVSSIVSPIVSPIVSNEKKSE